MTELERKLDEIQRLTAEVRTALLENANRESAGKALQSAATLARRSREFLEELAS